MRLYPVGKSLVRSEAGSLPGFFDEPFRLPEILFRSFRSPGPLPFDTHNLSCPGLFITEKKVRTEKLFRTLRIRPRFLFAVRRVPRFTRRGLDGRASP